MKGYIHVYTGNGKGKTTASIGLAVRAAGAGKKIYFAQFVKGKTYSEIETIKNNLPAITLKQYGLGCFIRKKPAKADIEAAQKGLNEILGIIKSGEYDMIILDEANIAVYYGLFSAKQLLSVVRQKTDTAEIIITGRYASPEILDIADLVTEMKEIKHYYNNGIQARKGIEF